MAPAAEASTQTGETQPSGGEGEVLRGVPLSPDGGEERPRLGSSRYGYTFRRLLLLSDLAALALATGIAAAALGAAERQGFAAGELAVLALLVPVWLLCAHLVDLYALAETKVEHVFTDELGPVFIATTVWIWACEVTAAAVMDARTELLGPAVLWAAAIVCLLVLRATARTLARHRSWFRRAVALVGDDDGNERVLRRIRRHPEWGLDPVAAIRVDVDDSSLVAQLAAPGPDLPQSNQPASSAKVPIANIAGVVRSMGVDRAIITGGPRRLADRTELIRSLVEHQFCVDYVSGEPEALYSSAVLHHLEGLPILTVKPPRIWRGSELVKRGIDIAVAGAGLLAMSPVLAYAALRIKLDSEGPILFRQPRIGKDGRQFEMLKLRTMVDGADRMRDEVRQLGIHGNGAAMLKVKHDPRLTSFGAKLRRWSLDELPQLWNVIRGQMSLVGPRPLPLEEAPLVIDHFRQRMRVRPGITGPWQIHGRSDIPFEDMVKLDYTYVVGWSLHEDMRLLVRTVGAVLRGRGAY